MPARYLTRAQAAEYIRDHFCIPCSVGTLDQYATDGTGPLYRRINRATLYDPADIDRWFEERATKPIRQAKEVPWNKNRRGVSGADVQPARKDVPPPRLMSTRQAPNRRPGA